MCVLSEKVILTSTQKAFHSVLSETPECKCVWRYHIKMGHVCVKVYNVFNHRFLWGLLLRFRICSRSYKNEFKIVQYCKYPVAESQQIDSTSLTIIYSLNCKLTHPLQENTLLINKETAKIIQTLETVCTVLIDSADTVAEGTGSKTIFRCNNTLAHQWLLLELKQIRNKG